MFAFEFDFKDNGSRDAMLIKRHQLTVGWRDDAHLVIDQLQELGVELVLSRGKRRSFSVKPEEGSRSEYASLLQGIYEESTEITAGNLQIRITSLDNDLMLREGETPDRAGVRVLRQAASLSSPDYPAIVLAGEDPVVVSFSASQTMYIGRGEQNMLRIDTPDVSGKHCRIGYESGSFWVEDLGSTNGTFVNQQQISGKTNVAPGQSITLGREKTIIGVTSDDQLSAACSGKSKKKDKRAKKRYPILLSCSEVARPARLEIPVGGSVVIGRDPSCDMWLGAPHVSRKHCVVTLTKTGTVRVEDESTNGLSFSGGILHKGQNLDLSKTGEIFNFGGDITLAVCFSEEDENQFLATEGAPNAFNSADGGSSSSGSGVVVTDSVHPSSGLHRVNSGQMPAVNTVSIFGSMTLGAKFLVVLAAIGFIAVCAVFISLLWSVLQ